MSPETPLSWEVESNQYRNMPVRGRGPCQTSTLLCAVVMFMYVHAWEEETGFPMGLGENWSSRLRKGAWTKALRASNSTNACFRNFVHSDVCPAHSFKSNPFSLANQSQMYRQIPALGRPCTRDFPRTSGCFHKNCLMKITESPFVARECHCDNHRGRGLNEPHPTSWNSCSLLISPFSVHSHVFLLEEGWLNLPTFFKTTAGWEWFCTINLKMSSPEVLLVRSLADRLEESNTLATGSLLKCENKEGFQGVFEATGQLQQAAFLDHRPAIRTASFESARTNTWGSPFSLCQFSSPRPSLIIRC